MSSDDDLSQKSFVELGFDELCELHETDPDRFEEYRLRALETFVESMPEASQPRLRGLMFEMHGESIRAKSQLQYNLCLSSMMMRNLEDLCEQFERLGTAGLDQQDNFCNPVTSAKIISFKDSGS